MQIKFGSPLQNECRCYQCGKMLAKIKEVTSIAIIEILCVRGLGHGKGKCNTLNVFKIKRNLNHDVKRPTAGSKERGST